jgi:hypothetical protein
MGYSSRGVKADGCNSGPPRRQWWTSRPRKKTTAMATTATLTRSTHTKHPRSEPGVFRLVSRRFVRSTEAPYRCKVC